MRLFLPPFILFTFLLAPVSQAFDPSGSAQNPKLVRKRELTPFEQSMVDYWHQCEKKMDFGTTNFLMGWTSMISEPQEKAAEANSPSQKAASSLTGFGKGLLLFPINTAGGLANLVTFLVPGQIPLPENGVDVDQVTGKEMTNAQ